jgi:hypothetical protein
MDSAICLSISTFLREFYHAYFIAVFAFALSSSYDFSLRGDAGVIQTGSPIKSCPGFL